MTVKELCKEYGLKFQTVYKKIKNHQKELDGHITKVKGKSLELDEFAVALILPIQVKVLQAVDECEAIARENDELKENCIPLKMLQNRRKSSCPKHLQITKS